MSEPFAATGNVEHAFITSVAQAQDAVAVLLVESEWFLDPAARAAWGVITDHLQKHGTVPGLDFVLRRVPTLPVREWSAAPGALADLVQQQWLQSRFFAIVEDAGADVDADPRELVSRTIEALGKLTTGQRVDRESQADLLAEAKGRYYRKRDGETDPSRKWPWAPMQAATGGAPWGSLTLFYGRPKNMKSWLMLYVILGWWRTGARVLTVLKEMTKAEWAGRLLVQIAGVSATRFRDGGLTPIEEEALDDAELLWNEYEAAAPAVCTYIGGSGREAALRIEAEGKRMGLQPGDVVAIDGGYLFSERDWQLQAQFIGELKQILLRNGWVGVMTMQANREADPDGKVKDVGREMGGGDAAAQDADMFIRVTLIEDRVRLTVPPSRNGEPCELAVHARPGEDFSLAAFDPAPSGRRAANERPKSAPSAARNRRHQSDEAAF